ncbi:MAG: T9SS type B sorting domain-containing protein, partial [Bacteroidia bacterium]
TSPPPAGYHGRSGGPALFGFVANPQLNNWLGSAYDGDFFVPGSPENGWGFEIGAATGTSTSHGNNCAGLQQINGAITNWSHTFNCYNADWEGDYTSGTDLHFKIDYFLQQTDLYYTTTVSITNNTAATIPDMYYYRNVDPDNNESIGAGFTTTNTIMSEPGAGCNLAHVKAIQTTPWTSYLGFAATGANWRADYGGFSNRGAADLWTGTGYTQTVGAVNTADEAISLAYRIQNLAPGATETFKFVVILDDASATAAINNLLYLSYPGSLSAPPSVCTPWEDTIRTCGGPVPITIAGPTVPDYNWTWSPTSGLTPSTGPSVSANPAVTTTYTASGAPINPCVTPVSLTFVVMVTPGGGSNPVITPVAPVCVTTPPFNFTADTLGGTWTTTCGACLNATTGLFNPAASGPGTFLITYTTLNTCNSTDTAYITVSGSDPTITPHGAVCQGSAPYNLTAASPGGTWSGTGITDPVLGTFNPSTAGSFTITYSLSAGACSASDSVVLVVNPTTPPVTGISYTSPVCISGPNPTPTTVAGFTTGGTYSATPAGLTINPSTGVVTLSSSSPGTYMITYSYAATGCGPAGSSTDTLVINPLIVPTLGFSYPTVCADGTNPAPVPGAGFTTGGIYTAPAGVSINDTTGVINLATTPPGTYTITYSVTGSTTLCTASGNSTASITINPLPTIVVSGEPVIFVGQSALIYASGGTTYSWSPTQDLSAANNDSTTASPPETTNYCVAVTNLGCTDTMCLKVHVEVPCPSNRTMGVPNAFSPNGDGVNDQLCLDGWSDCISKFQIVIFDRWGEKVFESSDPGFCWDGVYKGKVLDPAVFVYFIKATYETAGATPLSPKGSIEQNKKGNITLVR